VRLNEETGAGGISLCGSPARRDTSICCRKPSRLCSTSFNRKLRLAIRSIHRSWRVLVRKVQTRWARRRCPPSENFDCADGDGRGTKKDSSGGMRDRQSTRSLAFCFAAHRPAQNLLAKAHHYAMRLRANTRTSIFNRRNTHPARRHWRNTATSLSATRKFARRRLNGLSSAGA